MAHVFSHFRCSLFLNFSSCFTRRSLAEHNGGWSQFTLFYVDHQKSHTSPNFLIKTIMPCAWLCNVFLRWDKKFYAFNLIVIVKFEMYFGGSLTFFHALSNILCNIINFARKCASIKNFCQNQLNSSENCSRWVFYDQIFYYADLQKYFYSSSINQKETIDHSISRAVKLVSN